MRQELNEAQRQAATHAAGHLLIVAGPGTGKTHTLIHRIAKTAERLKDGRRILAITFTNKAAEEMRERLTSRFPHIGDKVFVGTFHRFCLWYLRGQGAADFDVADSQNMEEFSRQIWPGESKSAQKEKIQAVSRWKTQCFHEEMPPDVARYNHFLRQRRLWDYDDLLLEALKILPAQEKAPFSFVFVDEYQDINSLQHALLKQLVRQDVRITAIGDPNQAIYGFRGGDPSFFASFSTDFPGAAVLSLSQNYRSSPNLLEASGQVAAKSESFFVPRLTAEIYAQGRLTVYGAATDKAESEYVVHQIEQMVGGTSLFSRDSGRVKAGPSNEKSFKDIAVFYRLNAQRYLLEKALNRHGIPYQVCGEKTLEEDNFDSLAEKVYLSTLHAAKGLEFPVVFIVGCEDGLLPLSLEKMSCDPAEERRLFYVGMTRAQEALFLTHAGRRCLFGAWMRNPPSPYLADIEQRLKEYEEALPRKGRARKLHAPQLELFD